MLESTDPKTGKTHRAGDDCRPTCAGCIELERQLMLMRCERDGWEAQAKIAEQKLAELAEDKDL